MRKSLIIGLLLALVITVFALKNDGIVKIFFLWGDPVEGSLSLVLLLSVLIGIVVGYMFALPTIGTLNKKISNSKKENQKLQTLVDEYKKEFGHKKEDANTKYENE
ncbi:MAG: lipopolysaccharide assembly protein LapA domain-containing protein [Bacteroidales bacterium]|jgi:uncharacterized integral membrane protein|nr:lipopolysaccharide assembly protein LapA domain-containing protein [Bacteroidales bacterium]